MYKEIIIIVVVIGLIIGLDIITNNYTKQSLERITSELNALRALQNKTEGNKEEVTEEVTDDKNE